MTMIKRFFRLRYGNEAALQNMLRTGNAVCNDPDFAISVRPGDGIVMAEFDSSRGIARVRAIGVVIQAANAGQSPHVRWKAASFELYPSPQGAKFWLQVKPFFIFAKDVAARYKLADIFSKEFSETTSNIMAKPVKAAAITQASPMKTSDKSIAMTTPPSQSSFDRGGYVYLIRSPYGYKIGKTKRMKERSQLFSVKLPFNIEIIHYAWHEDYSRAETTLHQRYQRKRMNGEWFSLNQAEVEEIKKFRT